MDTLRKKTSADLAKLLYEKRESLRKSRFQAAGARSRDTKAAREIRKGIARILTVLKERETISQ